MAKGMKTRTKVIKMRAFLSGRAIVRNYFAKLDTETVLVQLKRALY